jgi:hypothetical protein
LAEDDRQRQPKPEPIDLSQLKYRSDFGDQIDLASVEIQKGSLKAALPVPAKRGRLSNRLRFELPIDKDAAAVVASYRVRLSAGISHEVTIEGSKGLVLFYFQVTAEKDTVGKPDKILADEWHSIAISQSRDSYAAEVDGKTVVSSQHDPHNALSTFLQFDSPGGERRIVTLDQLRLGTRR